MTITPKQRKRMHDALDYMINRDVRFSLMVHPAYKFDRYALVGQLTYATGDRGVTEVTDSGTGWWAGEAGKFEFTVFLDDDLPWDRQDVVNRSQVDDLQRMVDRARYDFAGDLDMLAGGRDDI